MELDLNGKLNQMLTSATRYKAPINRIEIIYTLIKCGIEPHEKWIEFQQLFGGMRVWGFVCQEFYTFDLFSYLQSPQPKKRLTLLRMLTDIYEILTYKTEEIDRSRPYARTYNCS